jgi:hypothetical protein
MGRVISRLNVGQIMRAGDDGIKVRYHIADYAEKFQ